MAKLIRNRRVEEDAHVIVNLTEGETPDTVAIPSGPVLVPLAVWQARRGDLLSRPDAGVWLDGAEDPAALSDDIDRLSLIAVHFPKFADGRGYSVAALLRSRHGYSGELRAIGDVLRDQFNYLTRCGFDTLQPAEGRYTETQLAEAIAGIDDFTEPYQAAVKPSSPLFRRVQRAA